MAGPGLCPWAGWIKSFGCPWRAHMKAKWRWHDVFGFANACAWIVMLLLLFTTTIAEKEKQAMLVSGAALVVLIVFAVAFVFLKSKGKLEDNRYRLFAALSSGIYTLFIISLFVPTEHEALKAHVGTSKVSGVPERLDAGKQAGSKTLQKISRKLKTDSLTLTVYDICIGKYKHQVHRTVR